MLIFTFIQLGHLVLHNNVSCRLLFPNSLTELNSICYLDLPFVGLCTEHQQFLVHFLYTLDESSKVWQKDQFYYSLSRLTFSPCILWNSGARWYSKCNRRLLKIPALLKNIIFLRTVSRWINIRLPKGSIQCAHLKELPTL